MLDNSYSTRSVFDFALAVASFGATTMRIALAAYAGLYLVKPQFLDSTIPIFAIVTIIILDYFDGKLFEMSTFQDNKRWRVRRRLFDSISDRFVIQLVCIPALVAYPTFLWAYFLILAKETIFSVYLAYIYSHRILIYPGPKARTAMVIIGLTTITGILPSVTMIIISSTALIIFGFEAFEEYKSKFDAIRRGKQVSDDELLEVR